MEDVRVKLATHLQFSTNNQVHLWNSKIFKN